MGAACKQTSSWEKYEGFENSLFSHWGFKKAGKFHLEGRLCVCVCTVPALFVCNSG